MKTIKFSNDNWEYETKCRRCNSLTTRHFSDKKSFDWMRFAEAMQNYINNPRVHHCKPCNCKTVQDVTAYSSPK